MSLLRRRLRRRPSSAVLLGLALLIAVGGRLAILCLFPARDAGNGGLLHEGECRLVAVHDGPILVVRQDSKEPHAVPAAAPEGCRLRLIGIEADSRADSTGKIWSREAAAYIRQYVTSKDLRLSFDKRRLDRNRCALAYVFVDDSLLNERLVREGLARAKEYPGDSAPIAKRLRTAESEARRAGRGLWSPGNL